MKRQLLPVKIEGDASKKTKATATPTTTRTQPRTQTSRTKGQDDSGWVAAPAVPKLRALEPLAGGWWAAGSPENHAHGPCPRTASAPGMGGSTFCSLRVFQRWQKDACGSGWLELPARCGTISEGSSVGVLGGSDGHSRSGTVKREMLRGATAKPPVCRAPRLLGNPVFAKQTSGRSGNCWDFRFNLASRGSHTENHTEWSGVKGTSVGHPAQPPAQAGSPTAGCRGPCPGGS